MKTDDERDDEDEDLDEDEREFESIRRHPRELTPQQAADIAAVMDTLWGTKSQ